MFWRLLVKHEDSYALNTLASSLAAAVAVPALFISPYALAQSGAHGVTQLAPVEVEGEDSPYQPDAAQSPKMTAPLLDTPRSVQVVPNQVMSDQSASSLQDVLQNSPGITFAAGEGGRAGGDLPVIRGQNAASSLFLDGMRDASMQARDTFNLEQVEIIKGPDSVYSGRGGAGGSINLVSKAPKAKDATEVTGQIGTDRNYRGSVDSNWRLGEKSAFRLNVMGTKGDVPGRDRAVNFERWGVAPSLMLGMGTPTRITLSYYHYQNDSMPDYSIPYDPRVGLPVTETLGISRKNFYGLAERDFMKTRDGMATVDFQHDFSDKLTLRNVVRYGRETADYLATQPDLTLANLPAGIVDRPAYGRYYTTKAFANQTDLSGEFLTGAVKHGFDLGFEYTSVKQTMAYTNDQVLSSDGVTKCPADLTQTSLRNPDPNVAYPCRTARSWPAPYATDTLALYGFDTLKFDEQWQASVGLRWDNYRTSGHDKKKQGYSRTDNLFNYQLGLAYKPVPQGTIYASYGTSSTPSAVAGATASDILRKSSDEAAAPEKSRSVEAGVKWLVLDERLTLTGAVFQDTRRNTNIEVLPNEYEQAGQTRVRGIELGFSGSITPAWNIYGGYTFLDSKLIRGGRKDIGAEGQDLPNTPRNAFSLWSTYKVLPELTLGGGAYYVDKVYGNADAGVDASGAPKARWVPSYWRFDAMAKYKFSSNLALQLNVLNVFDQTFYTRARPKNHAALGTGRAALLSVRLRY
ncbi:TonB-dependent receptor [Achromobacter xylosoxidans]|uniref:TonB-dependent receptor n=1 Tax=Alcaligenes xylosoxydans xylosoxydans TaxID=85698 RepID=UPI0006C4473E|nr:TonB-dependent siderophore receptor [Achromobacter xylosoxidans]MCH4572468.1 TonB-dependent siderophore receptor [Achromobacter xylosoxidans]MDD7990331.1 TonB-dependent siderophore receptor [Achromobacter xylosoxidans]OFO70517.1 ligand-gated channel [Achromobacter xylosoxidans]OMG87274.1 ligand-gated channel [Achromobacter xylosoxidans]PNL98910.1 TonB-dependent siderophore receptor [Achromobacter xylosoxidans]